MIDLVFNHIGRVLVVNLNKMIDFFTHFFGFIMTFGFIFCYVPQIIKIIKNKSSKDISLIMYIMSVIAYISAIFYMFFVQFAPWLLVNYVSGIVLCGVIVFCYFRYKE